MEQTTNFVIFGQGRSGSNLLRTLLNSHPLIHCDNELFNPRRLAAEKPLNRLLIKLMPIKHIEKMQARSNAEIYGFKLFGFHHKNAGKLLHQLYAQGWKIIYIQRKNVLKQVFSGIIGIRTQKYLRTENTPAPAETYHIPCEQVVNAYKYRNKMLLTEKHVVSSLEHCSVIYEEHLQEAYMWPETAARIFHFLDIDPVEVSTSVLKTDPRPDYERIENFGEIIHHLNENGYPHIVRDYYKYSSF